MKVNDGEFFPADLVILSSSLTQGMCYIETSSLDGETNLKVRSAIPQTFGLTDEKQLNSFVAKIKFGADDVLGGLGYTESFCVCGFFF